MLWHCITQNARLLVDFGSIFNFFRKCKKSGFGGDFFINSLDFKRLIQKLICCQNHTFTKITQGADFFGLKVNYKGVLITFKLRGSKKMFQDHLVVHQNQP